MAENETILEIARELQGKYDRQLSKIFASCAINSSAEKKLFTAIAAFNRDYTMEFCAALLKEISRR